MREGLRRLGLALFMAPTVSSGVLAQDPACCVLVPDGVTGVRVDQAPVPTNLKEVADSLEANRPGAVDGASTETAVVWLHVGTGGSVLETRIDTGTGSEPIDAMFLRVAAVLRFSPALRDGEPVEVWIRIPFTVQERR